MAQWTQGREFLFGGLTALWRSKVLSLCVKQSPKWLILSSLPNNTEGSKNNPIVCFRKYVLLKDERG